MTGFHEIKVLKVPLPLGPEKDISLPEGWKPFSSHLDSSYLVIVCRKWHRGGAPDPVFSHPGYPEDSSHVMAHASDSALSYNFK